MIGPCRLCGQARELHLSHIVPRFVWRWLKESSPTGHLRDSRFPNKRVQDGWKEHLLCEGCEQLLSADEKVFAERLFRPLHENARQPFSYEAWALRLGVSVVWRALVLGGDERLSHLSADQLAKAHRAERVWRDFLLGTRKHPGRHEVHLYPLDVVQSHTAPEVSPFFNRYLLRGVDVDVLAGKADVVVYAKMCRALLIGIVDVSNRAKWKGAKLNLSSGTVGGPVDYRAPQNLFTYMNERADRNAAAFTQLSLAQKAKLQAALEENIDAVANSEVFRAMYADVALSGRDAFRATQSPGEAD